MTTTFKSHDTFRITVIAASPAAQLAILSIAGHLGIEPRQVAARLASLPTVLAEAVAGPRARELRSLLAVLGLKVRLDPAHSGDAVPAQAACDLAIQMLDGAPRADRDTIARRLSARPEIGDAVIADALDGPEGLVLTGLPRALAATIRHDLRRVTGVRVVVSDPDIAEYDLFCADPSPELRREVASLGLGPCAFSGAAVAGVNRATLRFLMRRAGGALRATNRDFQRFDLILVGAPDLCRADLADFLATRPGADRQAVGRPAHLPLRIDADLPRRTAEQFMADYAAFGLEVRPRLRGLPAA